MTTRRTVIKAAAAVLAGARFGVANAQDKLSLTVASGIAPTVPTAWWCTNYIGPKLAELTNGRIAPNVQINGTLCSEHTCVQQALTGQIDIGTVSGGNIGAFGHTFDILNLPYLFKDDASAERLINGWLGQELKRRAVKEMGLHVISIIPSYGFRNVDNSVHEIRVPKDMRGIKFRVTKTLVSFTLIKAWGGVPVPYNWGQLYEGLQTGIVQGMYIPDAYVAARRFYEVCKYITETGGAWNTHIIFMAQKRYESLPSWARQAIDKIGQGIDARKFKVDQEWSARQDKLLKGKVKIYNPTQAQLNLWYAGAPPAWKAVKEKHAYDPEVALRAFKDQGQYGLIKEMKAVGAL